MTPAQLRLGWRILAACSIVAVTTASAGCSRPDTRPRQPIAFSHKIHAGDNAIACQYCHGGVRRGAAAGIPSVRLCMGCHQLAAANKPEVIKLRETFQQQRPIPWMRMNVIADFVYFNHFPHIAKGIPCAKCHGEVQTMQELRPAVNLADMPFCVECHRENSASVDCYTCHR
ncbi:MAG: cytochrome c3 family protein [Bacteroidota bacterium]